MQRTHRNFVDSHPKLLINSQILWIVVGSGLLHNWLPRIAHSWKAGESYNLPLGIAYAVIGVVLVVANFILVNSAVSRLQSMIASDPDPGEAVRR